MSPKFRLYDDCENCFYDEEFKKYQGEKHLGREFSNPCMVRAGGPKYRETTVGCFHPHPVPLEELKNNKELE